MSYKFIYIDDTNDKVEQGTIHGLEATGEIKIDFSTPVEWEAQINQLTAALPEANGLILDLRLNDNANEQGKVAMYRGSSIAQELRTLSKENTIIKKDFPIILLSANENMDKSLDQTGVDLFDKIVRKSDLGTEGSGISYLEFRDSLKWLSDGYNYLSASERTLAAIMRIPEGVALDVRFVDYFNELLTKPVHVIARFLHKSVINRPGFLIDEDYLSARLGVDKASPDWQPLIEKYFAGFQYQGAFSNYHKRWWMPLVEKFWEENISNDCPLRITSAARRVELLKQKTDYQALVPHQRQPKSKSDTFWVACKVTRVAIDTIDGFVIQEKGTTFEWQEREYICINEALRPTADKIAISPVEKARLQQLKELFDKNEQRIRK